MKGFRARKLDPIYLFPTEELPVVVNYLKILLPFLTEGLCIKCNKILLNRVDLLDQEISYQDPQPLQIPDVHCLEPKTSAANQDVVKYVHIPDECCDKEDDCDNHSIGSWNNEEKRDCDSDTQSIGSWKNGENGTLEPVVCTSELEVSTTSEAPNVRMSWDDMAQSRSNEEKRDRESDTHSIGSWKDGENGTLEPVVCTSELEVSTTIEAPNVRMSWADVVQSRSNEEKPDCDSDTQSIGSWKDGENGTLEPVVCTSELGVSTTGEAPNVRMSWADMAQEEEDELQEYANNQQQESDPGGVGSEEKKPELSRKKREYLRFMNVQRKKDFVCMERIRGKMVNVVEGLELHAGVFSAAEQKRIVDFVFELQEKGSRGEFKERTYTAPQKWMRGKGRVTIQFGCCYNYAPDKKGNPPGILRNEFVDPIPNLLKVMIRRLVQWHVLPPSCVPDSCIVNIYDEGDCIPPHIDNHDFVRPFCTVSFISECDIVFGSTLKIVGPGEFSGKIAIPLPVGSVLVLQGNGADVAKHCVPAVPSKRISITFRKMDEQKRPLDFVPEADLQGIEPLPYASDESHVLNLQVKSPLSAKLQSGILGRAPIDIGGSHSEPQQTIQGAHSDSGGSHSEPRQTTQGTYSDSGHSDSGGSHSEPRQTTRGTYSDNGHSDSGGSHSEPRQTTRGTYSNNGSTNSEPRQTTRGTYSDNGSRHSEPRQTTRGTYSDNGSTSEPRQTTRGSYSGNGSRHSEPRQTTRGAYSNNGSRHWEPRQTTGGVHSRLRFPAQTDQGTSQSEAQQTAKGTSHSEPEQTSPRTHSEPRQTTGGVHSRLRFPAQTDQGTHQSEAQQTAKGTSHTEPQQTSPRTHSEPRPSFTGTPQSEPRQTGRRTPWSQETYRPRARQSINR